MIKAYCDRCRKRVSSTETNLKVCTGSLRATHQIVNLCDEDAAAFCLWLAERPNRDEPHTHEPKSARTRRTHAAAADSEPRRRGRAARK